MVTWPLGRFQSANYAKEQKWRVGGGRVCGIYMCVREEGVVLMARQILPRGDEMTR